MSQLKTVDVETLNQWMAKGDIFLVDVREIDEHQQKAIEDSTNCPLNEVCIKNINLPNDQHTKLVLYCRSGRRSETAGYKLLDEGIKCEVYNLVGGILAWEEAGLPIKTIKELQKGHP